MKTSAGNYAIITLTALLSSIVLFGITLPGIFLAFLSGYFVGTSSPESKMNAEYAKLLADNDSKAEFWANDPYKEDE